MKPVATALDNLQSEFGIHSYFGAVLPTLREVNKKLTLLATANLKYCEPLVKGLQTSLNSRFPHMLSFADACVLRKNHVIASICHPYFQLRWLSLSERLAAQELFLKELEKLHDSTTDNVSAAVDSETSKGGSFFSFDEQPSETSSAFSTEHNDGITYLQHIIIHDNQCLSTLNMFPLVRKLFLKTNVTTPSSAPVERLFSSAGFVFMPRRNRLSDTRIEQLLALKKN